MKWTKETEPTNEIPYSHVKLETPIGEFIITWKGWKENPSYDVECENEWIGSNFDLDSAKSLAEDHILETANQLNGFIKSQLV